MERSRIPAREAVARIRFESERRTLEVILGDPDMQRRAGEIMKQDETEANRRRLLASGLRITDRIIPSLVETVRWIQRITHLQDRGVEIYVYDDPRQNAACMDFGENRLFLLLSSSLVEKMGERELIFVIGHELGHVSYGHHVLPVRAMLAKARGMPGERALQLMSWSRRAEISADRVGLLCCQEIHVATTALIKLSCGLTESLVRFNVDDYVSQMQDIEVLSESVQDTQDWFSSHPFNPLRVVALHYFWESRLLTELLGHSPANILTSEMDERINALLEFMEPEMVGADKNAAMACLLWGGYWVAASDGRIDRLESMSIRNMTDAQAVRKAEAEIRSSSNPLALIRKRFQQAAKRCLRMPPSERHALVQRLIVVARADKQLREEEKAVLRQVCETLRINPTFVEQMLLMIG
jgi:uncharacterized tellurite resistance protein B-like protein